MAVADSLSRAGTTTPERASESLTGRQVIFLVTIAFGIFLLTTITYPFRRPDYYLLADAFLHGRTWIDTLPMTRVDTIAWHGHIYLPFGPGPAILLLPVVALVGPLAANGWQPFINALGGAVDIGLLLVLVRRVEPRIRANDATWAAALFALSTPIWWITVRTGPWHFAQLVAVAALFVVVLELVERQRPWLIGISLALALLSRLTLAVVVPFVLGYLLVQPIRPGQVRARSLTVVSAWQLVAIGLTAVYNQVRFGSPLESGYALATIPPQLADLRAQGLFSLGHLPMNLELLFLHLPIPASAPWLLRPDGYGLSILIASPGLFLMVLADWRRPLVRWAAAAGVVVLVPSLLYYGGGWIQLGFRYMLDALPFIAVLVASAMRRRLTWWWKVLIGIGAAVSLWGVLWSYTLVLQ